MDVLVKHNGTNISNSVLSYEREHKICTGIGTLTIDIERTIGRTFDPWDSIDIHENGDFKVRYFISDIIDSVPDGKITLECQDESKRLVDFFIPESYVIDFPSYTRTWIETFLDMAGINYQFQTSSQGNLLSNHTQLGLTSAYEQILVLLQLSGWYMYFDGDGKAIIGTLQTDLADNTNSVNRSDILSITRASDDKMLRNRALVLGAFDPFTLSYAAADITVHTRWNYDRNDVRSMVVSNSNIPNAGSAYGIANMLIKEFSKITIIKRIELDGARDFTLGDACRVDSTVWRGKGLITTFGVRMSKDGLITDLTLDERCPRLFGFFDFGDYVYVGTFGDGIWRKHLRFDHTWYDFSTGLDNLEITDLHINNGIFGSVGSNGEMYYANTEEGPWQPLSLESLLSSEIDVVASGEPINYIPFSGISARAVIVDKETNNVKFGVDTASGINNGDYFMDFGEILTFSGLLESLSGVSLSGDIRGWIVEYDPFTGQLVGGLGSGIYPISLSGEYNFSVIDLENDGYNDYVSVRQGGGASVEQNELGYAMGQHTTAATFDSYDSNSRVLQPSIIPDSDKFASSNPIVRDENSLVFIDNGTVGERDIISINKSGTITRNRFAQDEDGNVISVPITNSVPNGSGERTLRIYRQNSSQYKIFYYTSSFVNLNVHYVEWDTVSNTMGSPIQIENYVTEHSSSLSPSSGCRDLSVDDLFAYILTYTYKDFVNAGGFNVNPVTVRFYMTTVNLLSNVASTVELFEFITPESDTTPGRYYYIPGSTGHDAGDKGPNGVQIALVQNGDGIKVIGHIEYGYRNQEWIEGVFVGTETFISYEEIYNDTDYRIGRIGSPGTGYRRKSQLTKTIGMINGYTTETGKLGFAFNGETFITFGDNEFPFHIDASKIHPLYTNISTQYIALDDDGDYWLCNAESLEISQLIVSPSAEYELASIFSNPTNFSDAVYWLLDNTVEFTTHLILAPTPTAINIGSAIETFITPRSRRGMNIGGFFFFPPTNWDSVSPIAAVDYIYFGPDELQAGRYLVLRREGMEYTIIEEESYPIREDISNMSPILTVGSGDNSFVSNYVYGDDLEVIFAIPSGFPRKVDDYRYTLLEPTTLGEVASGVGVSMMGLYVTESGVFSQDVRTYSGGWQMLYEVPSGYGTRIETSNYGLGGQYIFVTASGDIQDFYQIDPGEVAFVSHSGLPDSRATIIRLDDRN